MNYTEKYHLPQWEESDRILRTDFNQMCADLENSLDSNAQAAAEAAKLPYVLGGYTGKGREAQDIVVGFKPSFVLILSDQFGQDRQMDLVHFAAASEEINSRGRILINDDGFHLAPYDSINPFPHVNEQDKRYNYVAFR